MKQPPPPPFAHQARTLQESGERPWFAVFWEQGTGKTRLAIDTMAGLARAGEIDSCLVLAPQQIPRNWVNDELPTWAPGVEGHLWQAGKAGTQQHARHFERVLRDPFPVVTMSPGAFMTKRATNWLRRFYRDRRPLMIVDESTIIKSPGAKRTVRVLAAGRHVPYRRIMTGTPTPNKPFDVYSQMKFLHADFWKERGFPDYDTFKAYFGIYQLREFKSKGKKHKFMEVVGYRYLDELHEMLAPHSSRVTKDEALDLPPKLYSKRYFDMGPEQQRRYDELRLEYMTEIGGEYVFADQSMVRLLRLQQVTCNYLPTGTPNVDQRFHEIEDNNPRLACLAETLDEVDNQAIIWTRFTHDVDLITGLLKGNCLRYDGRCTDAELERNKRAFQAGQVQFLVGNPAAGSMGITLTAARTVVYYNNSFNWLDRVQSEDRAHRAGQEHPVEYVDICAANSVDTKRIIPALRGKNDVAAAVVGDEMKEWI